MLRGARLSGREYIKGFHRCQRGQIARNEIGRHPGIESRTDNLLDHGRRFSSARESGARFRTIEIWPDWKNSLWDIDQGFDYFLEQIGFLSNRRAVCTRYAWCSAFAVS